jgi:hypothetical protein
MFIASKHTQMYLKDLRSSNLKKLYKIKLSHLKAIKGNVCNMKNIYLIIESRILSNVWQ